MNSHYNTGLAFLKLLAVFGIVGCHLNMRPTTTLGEWLLHFTDTNVALFGIISGYFLGQSLNNASDWWDFFVKRVKRLLPAYFFWSLFYLLIKLVLDLTTKGIVPSYFKEHMHWYYIIFWGGAAAHLWYVISLFYISVALCLMRQKLNVLWPILMALAFLWSMQGWGGFFSWYPIRLLAFICAGLGVYYNRTELSHIPIIVWLGLLILSLTIHILAPWRGWISVYDVVVAVPLLMIFSGLSFQMRPWMIRIVNCSFGIYLVHVFIAFAIGSILRAMMCQPYCVWLLILDWCLVFIAALLLTLIILRIPIFKRIVM